MPARRDDWLDADEYPDDRDIDDLGDNSSPDWDPLTIGRVKNIPVTFWTRTRIFIVIVLLILLSGFVLTQMVPLFNH
jgi:hypothetical protein